MLRRSMVRLSVSDGTSLTMGGADFKPHNVNYVPGESAPEFNRYTGQGFPGQNHKYHGNNYSLLAQQSHGLGHGSLESEIDKQSRGLWHRRGSGWSRPTHQIDGVGAFYVKKQWPLWYLLIIPAAYFYTYVFRPLLAKTGLRPHANMYLEAKTLGTGVYGAPMHGGAGPLGYLIPPLGLANMYRFQPTPWCAGTYQPRGKRAPTGHLFMCSAFNAGIGGWVQWGYGGPVNAATGYKDCRLEDPRDRHYPSGPVRVEFTEDGRCVPSIQETNGLDMLRPN